MKTDRGQSQTASSRACRAAALPRSTDAFISHARRRVVIVPSFQFFAFAAIAALIFNLSRSLVWQNAVLLLVNLAFLSTFSHSPAALAPFAGFLLIGYLGARAMQSQPKLPLFVPLLVLVIAMFFWLKRYTFVPSTLLLH